VTTAEERSGTTTPTVRTVARRWAPWAIVTVIVLIAAVVALAASGESAGTALSATNPAPAGSQAVARVVEQQGVTVTETSSLGETAEVVVDAASTTIAVYDPDAILTSDQLERLGGLASSIVLIDPGFAALDVLAPTISPAGEVTGELTADCDEPAVTRAGTLTGDGSGFRLTEPSANAVHCLASGDDVYSLVAVPAGAGTITALGTTSALQNEHIDELGNAAFALTLFGHTADLVWYLPGVDDLVESSPPTLAELTPEWVTPVVLLLVLSAIAAAFWRGRRFGRLVTEPLPVTVRASETMEGRARLYATASARLHAADSLRVGTIGRVGVECGLPRAATLDDVIAAASALIDTDPGDVSALLVDDIPTTDRELVELSDRLSAFEARVHAAVRPGGGERMGE
jgi:hypothetical protein